MTKILFAVSCGLILGYGWQNGHGQQLTNASVRPSSAVLPSARTLTNLRFVLRQWGVDVSWRRFVNVMIGISAAWLWSWLPPVSSGKQSIRISYANVIGTLGDGLCSIVSEAGNRHPEGLDEQQRIESNMMASAWLPSPPLPSRQIAIDRRLTSLPQSRASSSRSEVRALLF